MKALGPAETGGAVAAVTQGAVSKCSHIVGGSLNGPDMYVIGG